MNKHHPPQLYCRIFDCYNTRMVGSRYCFDHTTRCFLIKRCPISTCRARTVEETDSLCEHHMQLFHTIFLVNKMFFILRVDYTKSYTDFTKMVEIAHERLKNNAL